MATPLDVRGIVVNYRLGPRSQRPRECLIQFPNIKSRSDASQLIGRRIAWSDGKNNTIIGVIVAPHGNKGLVRARFRRGLPGQALGSTVKIVG
ncbi:MAG: 50S ribosomal protein L35ae [Candidatus Bathyarchaeia archaeon]|nr:50S ribosomal protein L35ae [Candidatus Bathyarchaeota archaeon]